MQPFTDRELLQFAPRARVEYIEALVQGWAELQRAGLDTPLRLCEFLAQTAHETGGYTIIAENLNYTAARLCEVWPTRFRSRLDPKAIMCAGQPEKLAEVVYGGRLGNVEKGDGYRYRGRGFLQDTGRSAYQEYGRLIGVDLEHHPELLEKPAISLRVALARWRKMDLNRFADRHYTRAIGNAINRGTPYSRYDPIGHADRVEWFKRAWICFGDGLVPVPSGLALGAYGAEVELLQQRLRELGYPIGSVDRVFGPVLARAVAAFKLDHKRASNEDLDPDEIVDTRTLAALNRAEPIEYAETRTNATPTDLIAAGSTEAAAGKQQMSTGTMLAAASLVKGAEQMGYLDQAQQTVGVLPAWAGLLGPVIDAVQWGFRNAFWVVSLLLAIWLWNGGHKTLWARVKAHRYGWNLFR